VKVGDLIIFHEEEVDVVGLIVSRSQPDDDYEAVLLKFNDSADVDPLHYYDYELNMLHKDGSIKIQYAT